VNSIGQLVAPVWLAVALCGCFTARLPDSPRAPEPARGAPVIGLAKVQDLRPEQNVGAVGWAHFKLGAELDDYLFAALSSRLVQLGYSVKPLADSADSSGIKNVRVALQSVRIESGDALMMPADSEARCEVNVLNGSGQVVYLQRYRGSLSERVDSESLNSMAAVGTIAAKVLDQMTAEIVKDPDFQKAIR
jgi:hypothetical protein